MKTPHTTLVAVSTYDPQAVQLFYGLSSMTIFKFPIRLVQAAVLAFMGLELEEAPASQRLHNVHLKETLSLVMEAGCPPHMIHIQN